MARNQSANFPTVLAAGLLAWIVPGAGHVFLRRTLRGLILCVCINGLFWSGVAFGGVFTIEPRKDKWWFAAQMCTGASGLAGWYRQDRAHAATLRKAREEVTQSGGQLSMEQAYNKVLADDKLALVRPAQDVARPYAGIVAAMGTLGEPPSPKSRQESAP